MSKKQYEEIYKNSNYGNTEGGRCPAIDYLPHYYHWLEGSIVDWGCGRGLLVDKLVNMGIICMGVDQVDLRNGMGVADITKPMKVDHDTAICIDVLEHIAEPEEVLKNMARAKKAVLTVHNGSSKHRGVELHINRKPFAEWEKLFKKYFVIRSKRRVHKFTMLYLLEVK